VTDIVNSSTPAAGALARAGGPSWSC
jgi:hypothetical protein